MDAPVVERAAPMTAQDLGGKRFWLQRRDDMLVLELSFSNVTRVDDPAGTRLTPTVPGKPAQLTICFPPQAVLEQAVAEQADPPAEEEVSKAQFPDFSELGYQSSDPAKQPNPTKVVLNVSPSGQPIQFTAAGLLEWVGLVSDTANTALECVWGLMFQPASGSREAWLHNPQPEASATGVIALWHTRLMWGDGSGGPDFAATTPIPLTATTTHDSQQGSYPTSLGNDTGDIESNLSAVAAATQIAPLSARELTLSPLGATIDLAGNWPSNPGLVAYRHRAVLGRDEHVLVLKRGYLLPFGFPVELSEGTQRVGEVVDGNFGAAVLSTADTLVVLDPLMVYTGMPGLPAAGRQFPFRTLRVHERTAAVQAFSVKDGSGNNIPDINGINVPGSDGSSDSRYHFHLTAQDYSGNTIEFAAPGYFVPQGDAQDGSQTTVTAAMLAYDKEQSGKPCPAAGRIGLAIDAPGDTMADITSIYLGAAEPDADVPQLIAAGYLALFPRVAGLDANIPAIQALSQSQGSHGVHTTDVPAPAHLVWPQSYLAQGLGATGVYAQLDQPVAFLPPATGGGGLASLNTPVVGLSQKTGLVGGPGKGQLDAIANGFDPAKFFPDPTIASVPGYLPPTLLGFINLAAIVDKANFGDGDRIPQVTTQLLYGANNTTAPTPPSLPTAVRTSVTWRPFVKATSGGVLLTTTATALDINTTTTISLTGEGPPVTDVRGALSSFELSLAGGIVTVTFDSLAFTSHAGAAPKLDVKISKVAPGSNAVAFFQRLLDNLPGAGDIPHIDFRDSSLIASYSLAIPSIPMGAFLMQNLAISASVTLPLDGRPIQAGFSFASRDHPFLVTVSLFGGGGFLALTVEGDKLEQLEAQIDFGAAASLDLVVASASVAVTAGIHVAYTNGQLEIDGFFRATGQIDLLGIISISLEIYLSLGYESGPPKRFEGTAEFTVRVQVAFFSQSLSFSVSRSFSAGADPTFDIAFPSAQPWQQRCAAFAPMVGS